MDKTNVKVEFTISGDYFDPDEVSRLLQIEPIELILRGSVGNDRKIPSKKTSWTISTKKEESYDVDEQTQKVLSSILNEKNELREIKTKWYVSFILEIIVEVEIGEKPALHYTKNTIKFLGEIGAETYIDLYNYS